MENPNTWDEHDRAIMAIFDGHRESEQQGIIGLSLYRKLGDYVRATHQARRAASLAGIKQQEEAVSNDKPIPERWQPTYSSALKADHKWAFVVKTMAEELGAAEAALAKARKQTALADLEHMLACQVAEDLQQQVAQQAAALSEATESKNDVAQRWLNDASEKSEIIASLQQQLSEAQQERDEFRERLKSMREANASLVEQRVVSALQVAQQAATLSEARNEINLRVEQGKALNQDLEIFRQQLSEAQQALSKTTANYALSMSTANRDIESLQQQVTQQAATISQLQSELLAALKREHDSLSDHTNRAIIDAKMERVVALASLPKEKL